MQLNYAAVLIDVQHHGRGNIGLVLRMGIHRNVHWKGLIDGADDGLADFSAD